MGLGEIRVTCERRRKRGGEKEEEGGKKWKRRKERERREMGRTNICYQSRKHSEEECIILRRWFLALL